MGALAGSAGGGRMRVGLSLMIVVFVVLEIGAIVCRLGKSLQVSPSKFPGLMCLKWESSSGRGESLAGVRASKSNKCDSMYVSVGSGISAIAAFSTTGRMIRRVLIRRMVEMEMEKGRVVLQLLV